MSKIDTTGMNGALVDLAERLNSALNSRSTTFTISTGEAASVFAAISTIVVQNADLTLKILELQNQVLKEKSVITQVVVDPGRF